MTRSVSCWQCGSPIGDEGVRFCPTCGAPLVGSLTAWERFRRRPAWLQTLTVVGILAALSVTLTLSARPLLRLLRSAPSRTIQLAQASPTLQVVPPEDATPQPGVLASPTGTTAQPAAPTPSATLPASPPPAPSPSPTEDLLAALLDAAYRFQDAKAYSQRTGDTSQLSQDLTGDALQRQIELVERWRNQGCYWEITLNAPLEVTIREMRTPDEALIEVAKVETRLLYCGTKLESETRNDAYTTTYLMRRINGRWYTAERE